VNFPLPPAALPPGKKIVAPIEKKVGWAPEPVWTVLENRKSLAPDRPARNLVTIPTELHRRSICSVEIRMRSDSLDFIDSFLLLCLARPSGMVLSGRRKCVS